MPNLFTAAADRKRAETAPLAERMRPRTLDEFVGQEQLLGPGRLLRQLGEDEMRQILECALSDGERGLGTLGLELGAEARDFLIATAQGDARRALGTLEVAAGIVARQGGKTIELAAAEEAAQKKTLLYDRA